MLLAEDSFTISQNLTEDVLRLAGLSSFMQVDGEVMPSEQRVRMIYSQYPFPRCQDLRQGYSRSPYTFTVMQHCGEIVLGP